MALGEALGAALGLDVSSSSRRRRPAPSSGEALGLVLGAALGLLGLAPGFFMIVGDLVGHGVGDVVGDALGTTLGDAVGDALGTTLGLTLGMKVLGLADGLRVHPHPLLIALNIPNSLPTLDHPSKQRWNALCRSHAHALHESEHMLSAFSASAVPRRIWCMTGHFSGILSRTVSMHSFIVVGDEVGAAVESLGETDGRSVGEVVGLSVVGSLVPNVGDTVGARVWLLGDALGLTDGDAEGNSVGLVLGLPLGEIEGDELGDVLGSDVAMLGETEGSVVGLLLGDALGDALGIDGDRDGDMLGHDDGAGDGTVGIFVGCVVGTPVGGAPPTTNSASPAAFATRRTTMASELGRAGVAASPLPPRAAASANKASSSWFTFLTVASIMSSIIFPNSRTPAELS